MGAPGCDDAPVVDPEMLAGPARSVTLVWPYYENRLWLAQQLHNLDHLPRDLKGLLSLVVVDDGSPRWPAVDVMRGSPAALGLRSTRLFRIGVDVRWNWLAARNIGVQESEPGWVLLTDVDHVVPAHALRVATHAKLDDGTIYRWSRREHTGQPIHPHPNSWLMTAETFWRVGGYDEALSGHYGTDGEYRRRCARTAPIRILRAELVRHEHLGDSSTTHYLRKQPEDAAVKKLVRARGPGWKPRVLSFPYREEPL